MRRRGIVVATQEVRGDRLRHRSNRVEARAHVKRRSRIARVDQMNKLFSVDLTGATVALYLLPALNVRLIQLENSRRDPGSSRTTSTWRANPFAGGDMRASS
jgi:hypothetical protein